MPIQEPVEKQKDYWYKIEDSVYDKEEIEEMVEDGPMTKEEFLISKGLHDRPNSHMAIKAWEDYQDSFYDM